MKNWYSHAIVGCIVALFFIIILNGANQIDLVVSVIALLMGSVLPDVDHPSGKIRRFLSFVISGFIILLVYFFLTHWGFIYNLTSINILSIMTVSIILFISYILTTMVEKLIPHHRGFIHRFPAALIYAALCGLIVYFFGIALPLLVAVAGGIGYLTHIISDAF